MAILECKLKESFLKKADLRINHQHSRSIKPGDNIRVNLNVSKGGFNRTGQKVYEAELTLDLHAIEGDKLFFQLLLVQGGLFDVKVPAKAKNPEKVADLVEVECARVLFPIIKDTAINLSEKAGFNQRFFEYIEFERLLDPKTPATTQTVH